MRRASPAQSGYVQELTEQVRAYAREDQVFIIDGLRLDGSRFITSVSDAESITAHRLKFGIARATVYWWVRDGALFRYTPERRASDWRLQRRFTIS